jgi:hypothetical protein
VPAGQTATFTAAASGNPTPTVQWEVSTNGGTSWSVISGATSTTLTLNNVTTTMSGDEYEAIFTNSAGSATTTAAILTVNPPSPPPPPPAPPPAPPPPSSGNLIVNPGFETGTFSGWSTAAAPFSSYFGVGLGNQHSGSYAAYFGSYDFERDDIYQNVPTIPGHTYQISYWVANGGGGNTEIRSSWGGNVLEDLFPANSFSYQQHTFDAVATSTTTQFRIGGYQISSFWYLDDVSVTDITPAANAQAVSSRTVSGFPSSTTAGQAGSFVGLNPRSTAFLGDVSLSATPMVAGKNRMAPEASAALAAPAAASGSENANLAALAIQTGLGSHDQPSVQGTNWHSEVGLLSQLGTLAQSFLALQRQAALGSWGDVFTPDWLDPFLF